jgi:hypothetical protein
MYEDRNPPLFETTINGPKPDTVVSPCAKLHYDHGDSTSPTAAIPAPYLHQETKNKVTILVRRSFFRLFSDFAKCYDVRASAN